MNPAPLRFPAAIGRSLMLLACGVFVPASAQIDFSESRLLRREISITEPGTGTELATAADSKPATDWRGEYSLGLAYTDTESGDRAWNTPWQIDWTDDTNTVTAQSDGYARVEGAADISGFSDVWLVFKRKQLTFADEGSLSWSAGATVPVGGDIGSEYLKERVTVSYTSSSAPLQLTFSASLRRSEEADRADRNPYTQVLALQGVGKGWGGRPVFAQFVTAHPNGSSGWSSTLVCGHMFRVNDKLSGMISIARGLRRGSRDTTLEVDLLW